MNRIVKLHFKKEHIEDFKTLLQEFYESIRNQKGCKSLTILQDQNIPEIFFTYSVWEGNEYLEAYKKSELFGKVWPKTKQWFAHPPEAWSTNVLS
jgi:quinol monooxygenase YgiN